MYMWHVATFFLTLPYVPPRIQVTKISKSALSRDLLATISPKPNSASDQTWSDHMVADSSNQSCDDWHIVGISHR
jgi:hypothetical protein